MKVSITNEQIERLAKGEPPWLINPKWDAEFVIVYMAKNLLHIREKYERLQLDYEATNAIINDVY